MYRGANCNGTTTLLEQTNNGMIEQKENKNCNENECPSK
jgi:hypothetical protein